MTGLLLGAVFLVWLAACAWAAHWIRKRLPHRWRIPITEFLIFGLLLPLPLIDEIVGGVQFARLCRLHDAIQVNKDTAKGRTAYLLDQRDMWLNNSAVPIRLQKWTFVDVTTREILVEWRELYASGGHLIHMLKISEGNVPLTFSGFCAPGGQVDPIKLFSEIGIKQVERSSILKGEKK